MAGAVEDVAAAQARVSYTRSELDRSTRLLQESAIAQREHDERQNAHREADANLRAAQASFVVKKTSTIKRYGDPEGSSRPPEAAWGVRQM